MEILLLLLLLILVISLILILTLLIMLNMNIVDKCKLAPVLDPGKCGLKFWVTGS